ncbi:MAG: hypothetical protein ACNI25_10715 [Halarcobacter sp.]
MDKEELERRKNRVVGRPKLEKEESREKKVMLSFTQREYDELKKLQELLNRNTLTSTILYFIERGREAVREDFLLGR